MNTLAVGTVQGLLNLTSFVLPVLAFNNFTDVQFQQGVCSTWGGSHQGMECGHFPY